MLYAIEDSTLDTERFELRRGGETLKLEPKVFDVLAYLIDHRDRVVSKGELLDAVWAGDAVSESALPRCITAARKALGDDRSAQRVIQTAHGRGYRFVAPALQVPSQRDRTTEANGSPFVGREPLMADLHRALDDAQGGGGSVRLLVGEPGIGKTRTAEELAAEARRRGFDTCAGRCYEGGGAPAFWPWVQILRAWLEAHGAGALVAQLGSRASVVAELLPELLESGDVPAPPELGPDASRFRLFDGIASLLRSSSRDRPLVLVLDDLHWSDAPSLLLLAFLAGELRSARILVVGTYRDIELRRTHPLARILGELARQPRCSRLLLRGLSRDEVGRIVSADQAAQAGDALTDAVYEMTEGNPFFVREVVHLLAQEAPEQSAMGEDRSGSKIALPQGIREAVGRRLDGLSAECNALLMSASVLGREFDVPPLERMTRLPREQLLELLDEAGAAGITLAKTGSIGRHGFSHALVQQTLYEEIRTPTRVRLHRQAGEALEHIHEADLDPHFSELAHHFFQAAAGGDVEKAVFYAERAAERAARQLAFEEAVESYERALEALAAGERTDETRRCQLLLAKGNEELRVGERLTARASFLAAGDVARRLDRPHLLARAALGVGGRGEMGVGGDPEVVELLQEALARLGDRHPALRSQLLSRLVGTPTILRSLARRRELAGEALELAERDGDLTTRILARAARSWALHGPDHVRDRVALGAELLELASEPGGRAQTFLSYDPAFLAHEIRYEAFLSLADRRAASLELEAADALARQLRQPFYHWMVGFLRASRALSDGDYPLAEQLIGQGLAFGDRAQHPVALLVYRGQALWLALQRGQLDVVERGIGILSDPRIQLGTFAPIIRCFVDYSRGDDRAARRGYEEIAGRDLRGVPHDEFWLMGMGVLAELCLHFGDTPTAEILYAELMPYADLNSVLELLRATDGPVASYLGQLAAALAHWDRAEEHFRAALAMAEGMHARAAEVSVRCHHAEMLLRRGRRDDRGRIRSLLDVAERRADGFDRRLRIIGALRGQLREKLP